jgi:ribokinase
MPASRILVIGSANVDRIIRLPHLPARGETVTDGQFMQTLGGKGANQAVAAARAGGAVTFLAALGCDPEGDAMHAAFARDGIDVSLALRVADTPSGAALVMCDAHGDNYLAVAPGANDRIRPAHIDAAASAIAAAKMIVLQMEIPSDSTRRALELAAQARVPVLFNYAPVRARDVPVSGQMTWLVVNEVEAAALSGLPVSSRDEAFRAAEVLRRQGPRGVMVTLGCDGACILDSAGSLYAPAFSVAPVDSTAAGDTFCGALAVALVEGRPLPDAVRFASAAAAIGVTRLGAQSSIPVRPEIDAFLHAHPRGG